MARQRTSKGKTILWTVVITLMVVIVGLLIFPYTGAVDVAATQPHLPGVHWFLETTQRNSVASLAAGVEVPTDLTSPARVNRGLVSYHQMCVGCHGAPGFEPGWMGEGLNPQPPELWRPEDREITEAQAARDYWVVEHGIRMTGMPALEPTHGEEEIWDLVAFVQQLPEISEESYRSALRDAGLSPDTGHEHGEHGHGDGEETEDEEGAPTGTESPETDPPHPSEEAAEDPHHDEGEEEHSHGEEEES